MTKTTKQATPTKSPVVLETAGQALTLAFGVNAVCQWEQAHKVGVHECIVRLAQRGQLADLRLLFLAAVGKFHPDITLEELGVVMEDVGVEKVEQAVVDAIEQSSLFSTKAKPRARRGKKA